MTTERTVDAMGTGTGTSASRGIGSDDASLGAAVNDYLRKAATLHRVHLRRKLGWVVDVRAARLEAAHGLEGAVRRASDACLRLAVAEDRAFEQDGRTVSDFGRLRRVVAAKVHGRLRDRLDGPPAGLTGYEWYEPERGSQ